MWREKLQQITQEKKLYEEEINAGATREEIQRFLEKSRAELNVDIPDEYIKVLETFNGMEFNGFILYGIDEELLDTQQNEPIDGMIAQQKMYYENEWQKQYLFLGESDISWYVYDLAKGRYCELDNPSGNECEAFEHMEGLMEKMFDDALA